MTPSARCLAVCRRRNWIAQSVEQRIPIGASQWA